MEFALFYKKTILRRRIIEIGHVRVIICIHLTPKIRCGDLWMDVYQFLIYSDQRYRWARFFFEKGRVWV